MAKLEILAKGVQKRILALVYVLFLVSFFIEWAPIIAVVVAYLFRNAADKKVGASHFRYQIRTFWLGLLYFAIALLIGFITVVSQHGSPFDFFPELVHDHGKWREFIPSMVVGGILFVLLAIWWLVRVIRGLILLNGDKPHPAPQSYLF